MTKISETMLELAQAYQEIVNTQQQNHQAMVNVQQQQAKAILALAAATQQQKYDVMFAAIPNYDGKIKKSVLCGPTESHPLQHQQEGV